MIARQGVIIMSFKVHRAKYFYATVRDQPGEAYKVLRQLVELGINLLAFTTCAMGPTHTQLSIFPADTNRMLNRAKRTGLKLKGPYTALLVQGDDELGSLIDIHAKLFEADINVSASSGVADGIGGYGYVIYIRPEDFEKAIKILGI